MPFRPWFYLTKIGAPILFAFICVTFAFSGDSVLGLVRFVALSLLISLCLVGALMGTLISFDKLRMRCPFCRRSGPAGCSKTRGMWMECDSCGFIHGSGLEIVKGEITDDF